MGRNVLAMDMGCPGKGVGNYMVLIKKIDLLICEFGRESVALLSRPQIPHRCVYLLSGSARTDAPHKWQILCLNQNPTRKNHENTEGQKEKHSAIGHQLVIEHQTYAILVHVCASNIWITSILGIHVMLGWTCLWIVFCIIPKPH